MTSNRQLTKGLKFLLEHLFKFNNNGNVCIYVQNMSTIYFIHFQIILSLISILQYTINNINNPTLFSSA